MNIDWDFELEKAVGTANHHAHTEVIQLRGCDYKLTFITYLDKNGHPHRQYLPGEWHKTGQCSIVLEDLPVDLTDLGGGRVEIHFPLGMHEHAKLD